MMTLEQVRDNLSAVLCDTEGRCCIQGSSAERAVVDDALDAIDAHLAQQPDLAAIWEVIDELLSQPFIDRSHEWRSEIADKLAHAIGDKP